MPFSATDWTAEPLSVWLTRLRDALQRPAPDGLGPTAVVTDDRYTLARLVIVIADALERKDAAIGEALAGLLDENSAVGVALDVLGYRRGVVRAGAKSSRMSGLVYGTVGTVLGGQLVQDIAGVNWQLEPVTIGITGVAAAVAIAVIEGPSPVLIGPYTLGVQVAGWNTFEAVATISIGRFAQSDDDYRTLVIAARSVRGAVEFAIDKRLREVSNVTESVTTVNRTNATVNGVEAHHLESVVTGGADLEVASALLIVAASATAGFNGNTVVDVPHPQDPLLGTVPVRFSRAVDIRGFVDMQVLVTGAPVPQDPNVFARQIRALIADWTQTLRAGKIPLSFDLEKYIGAHVPEGTIVSAAATFSLDNVTYSDLIALTKYERFRAAATPQYARIVGTVVEPYAIGVGVNLDISKDGGPPASVVFTGLETTAADVVATVIAAGLFEITAVVSPLNTLELRTTTTGLSTTLEITIGSDAGLLATLGLFVGAIATGTNADIGVTLL